VVVAAVREGKGEKKEGELEGEGEGEVMRSCTMQAVVERTIHGLPGKEETKNL